MTTMTTAETLDQIFRNCLYTNAEIENGEHRDAVMVEGVVSGFGLHPKRVLENADAVKAVLETVVSDKFMVGGGGGASFLELPGDRAGEQWGEHQNAEQLVVLSVALGWAKCLMPRAMWHMLPGGTPYYVFDFSIPAQIVSAPRAALEDAGFDLPEP